MEVAPECQEALRLVDAWSELPRPGAAGRPLDDALGKEGRGQSGCRGGGTWHTPDSVIWFLLAVFLPFLRVSLSFPRNSS